MSTQKERILSTLKKRKIKWTERVEFLHEIPAIINVPQRIHELKLEGYEIESRFVKGKTWKEYRLKREGEHEAETV